MSADILGTSWDQCWSMVQHSFTSMETRRLVRMDSPGRPPRLSHSSWTIWNIKQKQYHLFYALGRGWGGGEVHWWHNSLDAGLNKVSVWLQLKSFAILKKREKKEEEYFDSWMMKETDMSHQCYCHKKLWNLGRGGGGEDMKKEEKEKRRVACVIYPKLQL